MKIALRIFLLCSCISGCGNSDDGVRELTVKAPTNVLARDIGNFGDARDIGISFNKPLDISLIDEFRLFIVPEVLALDFNSLAAISEKEFVSIAKNGSSSNISMDQSQKDVEGVAIIEGKSYVFFVMSMFSNSTMEHGLLSTPSPPLTLNLKNVVRTLTVSLNEGTGGMDTDSQGNIYVADFGAATNQANGNNVLRITPDGEVTNFASGFMGASGNDFDNNGNLYQSNIGGNTVSKITPEGSVTTFATGLNNPVGIAFDGNAHFYVCNCGNDTISRLDMDGNVTEFASSSLFNCPNGIDIDENGNLYIASFGSSTIVKITPDGTVSSFATMPGNNNGHLLIRGNSIYVVSRGLHQIHQLTFTGEIKLLAGSGTRGIVDGPLDQASFSLPNDIAFSPDGKYLYVNDVNGSNTDGAVISPSIIRVIELVE